MKVVELFAGVGGFRLAAKKTKKKFNFVWANQWEPTSTNQFAFNCYQKNFGIDNEKHINENLSLVKEQIPFDFDLLVGGFPCQDYSVATTKAKGIEGIKGVLWWEINWILEHRNPRLVLLENVDRLLKSPSSKRGRDFAIMLYCFYSHGYNVEWMMNNGADFGFVQRRKRVFIYAYKNNEKNVTKNIFHKAFDFKVDDKECVKVDLNNFKDLLEISNSYNFGKFYEYGTLNSNGLITSYKYESTYKKEHKLLKDVLEENPDRKYFLKPEQIEKMKYLRAYKRIERFKNGKTYYYSEGKMNLYDELEKKSRTMLTSEATVNRSTHLINDCDRPRFLTPIEAERLNGFEDNWTLGMTDRQRYFCMGNALNVDLVAQILKQLK